MLENAYRLAATAGMLSTLTPGTEICHKIDMNRLMSQIKVERQLFQIALWKLKQISDIFSIGSQSKIIQFWVLQVPVHAMIRSG